MILYRLGTSLLRKKSRFSAHCVKLNAQYLACVNKKVSIAPAVYLHVIYTSSVRSLLLKVELCEGDGDTLSLRLPEDEPTVHVVPIKATNERKFHSSGCLINDPSTHWTKKSFPKWISYNFALTILYSKSAVYSQIIIIIRIFTSKYNIQRFCHNMLTFFIIQFKWMYNFLNILLT